MRHFKKIFIVLLVLAMIIQIVPVFAAEDGENINGEDSPEQIENSEPSETTEEASDDESTTNEVAETTPMETEVVEELQQPKRKLLAQADDLGCYLDLFIIKSQKDGTAPWDANDDSGNDSSDSNGIVRTFDNCIYNFEYTTALSGADTVDEADLMCEFVLNEGTDKAEFDADTLTWMLDRKTTYYFSDGTNSTTNDKDKTVVKQVLTGRRHLKNSSDSNVIPGVGTLICGLTIKAAKNGDTIKPEFNAWMTEDDKKTVEGNAITVSAAPRYNINLVRDGGKDVLGYFDFDNGTFGYTKNSSVRGRMVAYPITLQLYNDSVEKRLKGIEFPTGDLSFDIVSNTYLNDVDVTSDEDLKTEFWDDIENYMGTVGEYGRNMYIKGISTYAWYGPSNKGTERWSCYNGGDWHIEQDETEPNIYHVTIKDYEFDKVNYHFPASYVYGGSTISNVRYYENVGCFSCGYIQFVSRIPEEVDTTSTLVQQVEVKNLKVKSESGQDGYDVKASDNKVRSNITLYPRGSLAVYQRYTEGVNSSKYLSTEYFSGDNICAAGQNIGLHSFAHGSADFSWIAFNLLQKFDDKAFEVIDETWRFVPNRTYLDEAGVGKRFFVAKPDKTGWIDDEEMKDAQEEDLIFFTSLSDLKDAGYTCVGFFYEVRDCRTTPAASSVTPYEFFSALHTREDVEVGSVYQTVSTIRAWNDSQEPFTFTYTDAVKNEDEHSYGVGDGRAEYIYAAPKASTGKSVYTKVWYEDGVLYGHTGGYGRGNSILIIGDNATVAVQSRDEENTEDKSIFDLDMGERTATFTIYPRLNSDARVGATTSITDNVHVTAKLPKDLTYVVGSATLSPSSVTENADGTTTIVWDILGCAVDEAISQIDMQCIIGHAGTKEDVHNNDKITLTVGISSDLSPRAQNTANGNLATSTIQVIRLAATAVSKEVDKPLLNKNMDFQYTLHYGNNAEENANGVQIYDELPYSEDENGSSYHGSYNVNKIEIDFSSAPKTLASWDGTLGTGNRGQNIKNALTASNLPEGTLIGNKLVWDNLNISPQALILKFSTLFGQEYLSIDITCHPTGNKADDVYVNKFRQNATNQAAPVISNTVRSQVVNRSIKGLIFNDRDVSGTRNDQDVVISGRKVKLYSTVNNGGTAYTYNGVTYYPAKDMDGNDVSSTITSTVGEYNFTNLADGDYVLVTSSLGDFVVTEKNVGNDTTIDSDAEKIGSDAVIGVISLPTLENMATTHYIAEHNDFGLYIPTRQVVIKKNVIGNLGDLSKEFEFTLKLDSSQRVPWIKGATNGVYIGSSFSFKLKDDETITVELPIGVRYTLSEGACDHVGSYTITSNAANPVIAKIAGANIKSDTELKTATETVDGADGDITISVVNERNLAVISGTVYRTDFIIATVGLLIGIVILFMKRNALTKRGKDV